MHHPKTTKNTTKEEKTEMRHEKDNNIIIRDAVKFVHLTMNRNGIFYSF